MPERIVMLGTDPTTHGGISSVLSAWADAGLFARWPIVYVPTHRHGTRLEKLLLAIGAAITFVALILRMRRCVVHVHGASRASFWRKAPFILLARLVGWPVVFHLHGGAFQEFYERECGPARRAIVRYVLARTQRIIVVSPRWEAWVRATFSHVGVECVTNAVPIPRVEGLRDPARIAFLGRLTHLKGAYDLIDAVALLRERAPQVRLELAGDGDGAELARYAHALGMGDRVLVRGWCGPEECTRMLARSGLFVLPSHVEALPMSLLEAMAAGCAVIATRVGGVPDAVHDGVNGLLVSPRRPIQLAEAIARLLADPALATKLGRAARATIARRHSPEAAVRHLG
ncbi:MAG TPA: glycosyltransferase family 4 protein, partial [Usitatibacter sp.]|nr:glycosyltransferase family 4 protein [Usitatibacter sp.]